MTDFLTLVSPSQARELLLSKIDSLSDNLEELDILQALGRVNAEDIFAPHPLPNFSRSTVDGFAVRAKDTYGASESTPSYLVKVGEVPMGSVPSREIQGDEAMIIHTGGMLPNGADAVVMLEYVQESRSEEIEVSRPVATGENVISVGEDVVQGQVIIPKGTRIRPAEIGGLSAFGISKLRVVKKIKVGVISSGDEVMPPDAEIKLGQVRDINSYSLASLISLSGGEPILFGIVPDRFEELRKTSQNALNNCDVLIITAGSSASTRDMTANVINQLGPPGVLVHGINTRPGKPMILGVCNQKAVIGLPGNPVSALVNGLLFLVPLLEKLSGQTPGKPHPIIPAKVTVNLASQAGREDWQPVKLKAGPEGWLAEPVFGKSNLIFTLVSADGLFCIPPDSTGLSAGDPVEVYLL
jgi:molybdopterin molybdotransferase